MRTTKDEARNNLYAPHAQKEAEDIRLLLFVQLSEILVGTHVAG